MLLNLSTMEPPQRVRFSCSDSISGAEYCQNADSREFNYLLLRRMHLDLQISGCRREEKANSDAIDVSQLDIS